MRTNDSEILVLSEIEAVRKNPSMYIGSTGTDGAQHLLYELIHNAVDEAVMGSALEIELVIGTDFCSVRDNGRGIPIEIHPREKIPASEVVLTRLHSGSKFIKDKDKFTAGLHGVGLSCVNALSSWLKVEISRKGSIYFQEYCRGEKRSELQQMDKTDKTGTLISFWPDREIFKTFNRFDEKKCLEFLEDISFLRPGLNLSYKNLISNEIKIFRSQEGIRGLLNRETMSVQKMFSEPIGISFSNEDLEFEAMFLWTTRIESKISSYVNFVNTIYGGTHVNALKSGLLQAINKAVLELKEVSWKGSSVEMEEMLEGLFGVIDLKLMDPNFEGQTKTRLTNVEIIQVIENAVAEQTFNFLKSNPQIASVIIERILQVRNAKIASKRVAERIYFQHGDKVINEEIYKEQFGARSKNWHDSAVWITHDDLLQKHAEFFEKNEEAIALDVCCGSGVVGASFKSRVKKVIGLDLTPEMVKLSSERLDEVHQGTVYNIPFPDNSFDLVCTREVLHLLPYPERPVSEIYRVLKPGGQFIVGQILPFGEADAAWMYRVFKKKQPLIFNMFQEEDFKKMLTTAGFIDLQMEEINVWESIDVWINSFETTSLHRHEIRELFRNAPKEAREIHPFKINPDGEIFDLWRWCIFSVRK